LVGGTALGLHLLLIVTASLRDISVMLPDGVSRSVTDDESFSISEPLRRFLAAYFDCAGIEAGYSFFAPTVPGNTKLAFELLYRDGHVEYDVPVVNGAAAGDRISSLLDHLRVVRYVRLREALLRSLVEAIHREHPDAVTVRAVLGAAELTTPADYRVGKRITYQPVFAYDFHYDRKIKPALGP
jgi:hypothetical protein